MSPHIQSCHLPFHPLTAARGHPEGKKSNVPFLCLNSPQCSHVTALGEKSWRLTKATQDLQAGPGGPLRPDLGALPPTVLTDLPETFHMLFPLPGRSSPNPSPATCPKLCPITFSLTSGSELRHLSSKSPLPNLQLSGGSPCMNPISNLFCPQLPFFPSFSFPPSFHRAPTPCQLWRHKDRHGPSRTQSPVEETDLSKSPKYRWEPGT